MKYTGQVEDADVGLYYYGARYYDPEIGRFITEDSYQGDIGNPCSQNQYVYVLQNPLKYVDPTGHMANISSTDGGGIVTEEDAKEFEEYWNSVPKPEEFWI